MVPRLILQVAAVTFLAASAPAQAASLTAGPGGTVALPAAGAPSRIDARSAQCRQQPRLVLHATGRASRTVRVRAEWRRVADGWPARGASVAVHVPGEAGRRCRVRVVLTPAGAVRVGAPAAAAVAPVGAPAVVVEPRPAQAPAPSVAGAGPVADTATPATTPSPHVAPAGTDQPTPTGTSQPPVATTTAMTTTTPAVPPATLTATTTTTTTIDAPAPVVTPAPVATPTQPTAPEAPAQPTPAPAHHVVLGAAIDHDELTSGDPRYAATFATHFDSLTPENEMKFDATEPARGVFTFDRADDLVAAARANGQQVRGHTLIWHDQLPAWVTDGNYDRDQLIDVLEEHVTAVVSHFRGRVATWDVVNEPLDDDGSLRPSIWERVIGPEYLAIALRAAHRADPAARLVINDYAIDLPGPRSDGMVRLVRSLQAEGAPLDAVGSQMHLFDDYPGSAADIAAVLRRYAALGVQVDITELDVAMSRTPQGSPERYARQAHIYGAVAQACQAVDACHSLTTWGVSDARTWRGSWSEPLLFDTAYAPKPAWTALALALGRP